MVALLIVTLLQLHNIVPASDAVLHEFREGEIGSQRDGPWQKIALPHDWHVEKLAAARQWYRFSLPTPDRSGGMYAVYLPVISQNAVVYLNGVEIGSGGSQRDPVSRNWPRPLIFPVAANALQASVNELMILVISDPAERGLLPVFYFGNWADLIPSYDYRKMLKQTALGAAAIILLTVALFLFYITWKRKKSTEYAWGAATFLALSGHSMPVFFQHIPASAFLWEWWQHLCIGSTVLFMLIFVNRYFEMRMRKTELGCTFFMLVLAVLSYQFTRTPELKALYFRHAGGIWGLCSLLIGLIPLWVTLTCAISRKNIPALFMLSVGTVMFILGGHDVLFTNGIITRENGYLIHYASPLMAILLTAILIQRLLQTSGDLEELNNSLEQRIEQSNQALAASYEKVRKMESERLLAAERERFNRDMHDGLGGHLSTALALAESNVGPEASLTSTIRDATEEMRLMLDTAEAVGEDIGMIIGPLRQKLQRQSDIAGFKLIWQIEETPAISSLDSAAALNVVRIVQEAVSNALRHSGGDAIRVRVSDQGEFAMLQIADNGNCLNLLRIHGKGVRNLENRANELGASIRFNAESDFGGLSVSVEIPLTDEAL